MSPISAELAGVSHIQGHIKSWCAPSPIPGRRPARWQRLKTAPGATTHGLDETCLPERPALQCSTLDCLHSFPRQRRLKETPVLSFTLKRRVAQVPIATVLRQACRGCVAGVVGGARPGPLPSLVHHTHLQRSGFDKQQALDEVLIGVDDGGMETPVPQRAASRMAPVVRGNETPARSLQHRSKRRVARRRGQQPNLRRRQDECVDSDTAIKPALAQTCEVSAAIGFSAKDRRISQRLLDHKVRFTGDAKA